MSTSVGPIDDFEDGVIDTGKWSTFTNNGHTIAETGGHLVMTMNGTTTGNSRLQSLSTVSVGAGNHVVFEVPTVLNQVAGAQLLFDLTNTAGSPRVRFAIRSESDGAARGLRMEAYLVSLGNANNTTTITFDATNHRWLRFRRSDDGLNLYWETSASGADGTWTIQRTVAVSDLSVDLSTVGIWIASNQFGTLTGTGGSASVDNANNSPAASTQEAGPVADESNSGWTGSPNNTAGQLYQNIDEATASDTDYVQSSIGIATDVLEVQLAGFATVISGAADTKIQYRLAKVDSNGNITTDGDNIEVDVEYLMPDGSSMSPQQKFTHAIGAITTYEDTLASGLTISGQHRVKVTKRVV